MFSHLPYEILKLLFLQEISTQKMKLSNWVWIIECFGYKVHVRSKSKAEGTKNVCKSILGREMTCETVGPQKFNVIIFKLSPKRTSISYLAELSYMPAQVFKLLKRTPVCKPTVSITKGINHAQLAAAQRLKRWWRYLVMTEPLTNKKQDLSFCSFHLSL